MITFLCINICGHFMHGSNDAIKRIALTKAIIFDGSVVTKKYGPIKYYPLQSIIMIPPYAAGYYVGKLMGEPEKKRFRIAYRFCAFLYNPVIISILAVVFFNFLGHLKIGVEDRAFSLLILLYGTLLSPYTRIMFSEPLSALLILLSLIYFYRAMASDFRKNNCKNFICCALLVLNGPVWIVYFGLMLIAVLVTSFSQAKDKSEIIKISIDWVAILVVLSAMLVYYNLSRYSSFLPQRYDEAGFDYPLLAGVYGLFFSVGAGILIYSPITLCTVLFYFFVYDKLPQKLRYMFALTIIFFFVFILIYSKWYAGLNPWSWGPRFLLPFVPALHLIFPFILKALRKANPGIRGLFILLCIYAIGINWFEFIGVWSEYVGDTLNQFKLQYSQLIFVPQHSALLNSWNFGYALTRGFQFLLAAFMFYYLTMKFKKSLN